MSACGSSSLRHIFDSTIPENSSSSLIDSLSSSWKHIRPLKPPADHSFTEIFGELHFKENPNPLYSSPTPWQLPSTKTSPGCYNGGQQDDKWGNYDTEDKKNGYQGSYHKRSDSFSSLNSESLQLCTEGLGSESLGEVEDLKFDQLTGPWQNHQKQDDDNNSNNNNNKNYHYQNYSYKMGEKMPVRGHSSEYRKRRTFPPPISCIGKTGKPGVCFESYRQDGRFVLKEIKIQTHDQLQASREDGRLRLSFIQPSEEDEDDTAEAVDDEGNCGEEEGGVEGVLEEDEGEESENGVKMEGKKERKEETEVRDDIERGHS